MQIKKIKSIFDMADIFILISLIMIFYGFYIWKSFLAFIVVGFLLLWISSGMHKESKSRGPN